MTRPRRNGFTPWPADDGRTRGFQHGEQVGCDLARIDAVSLCHEHLSDAKHVSRQRHDQ